MLPAFGRLCVSESRSFGFAQGRREGGGKMAELPNLIGKVEAAGGWFHCDSQEIGEIGKRFGLSRHHEEVSAPEIWGVGTPSRQTVGWGGDAMPSGKKSRSIPLSPSMRRQLDVLAERMGTSSTNKKKGNSFPLRLSPRMREQLEVLAKREGISINQLICIALTEKITRLDISSDPDGIHSK